MAKAVPQPEVGDSWVLKVWVGLWVRASKDKEEREFLTERKEIPSRGKSWQWEGASLWCSWVGKGHHKNLGRVSSVWGGGERRYGRDVATREDH